jgi:hypothetical protein
LGPIPPELGNLASLTILDLSSNNNLSSPIPSQLGNLISLQTLDLHNTSLLGPILPQLGNLGELTILDLSNNNLSGPIPPQLGNLAKLKTLGLGDAQSMCDLNLSAAPSSCQYIKWTGHGPSRIQFWGACKSGCTVDLTRTSSRVKLSRNTKRQICLSKMAVFLEGDEPTVVIERNFDPDTYEPATSTYLSNSFGNYFLNDPNFVDHINLGPNGTSYTGIERVKVPHGNLCGNPGARSVVGAMYGTFVGVSLVSTFILWGAARWYSGRKASTQSDFQCRQ